MAITKQTQRVFLPSGRRGYPLPTRNNQQANRVADDNNRSNDENGMEIDSSKLSESDSSVESAVVAEEVECDNIAEATNQHVSGSDSNQVDRRMPESEDTAGATGATNITVNYSGMQSRKGEMLKTGNVKMYSIEISPSMSIEDLTTSIFSHVKCHPDLSSYKLILYLGDDDSNPIDTNSKATVGELNLVHQGFYRVHLVLNDQPYVRKTATEAKQIHEQQIETRKQSMEEAMKQAEEAMKQAIYPSKPKKGRLPQRQSKYTSNKLKQRNKIWRRR